MSVAAAEVVTVLAGSAAVTLMLTRPHPPNLRRSARPQRPTTPPSATPPPACAATDMELWVRVLGPVLVTRDDAEVGLTARQTELTALLAAHPEGLTEDRVRAALWGDRPTAQGSFNNLVSATRRQLGTVHGDLALPLVGDDRRYRLHSSVGCDLRLLDNGDADGEALLAAVRGVPFDAPRGYRWAERDGLTSWAAGRIATVAHRVAGAQLAAGQPRRALQAAQRGLLAGLDERLFADRMQAHAALGETAAVDRVLEELLAAFDDEDPVEVLHPDTIETYRRCGGRLIPDRR